MLPKNERMEPTVSLPEIFADLIKRLAQIKLSIYDYTDFNHLFFENKSKHVEIFRPIPHYIFNMNYQASLHAIDNVLNTIKEIESDFDKILDKCKPNSVWDDNQMTPVVLSKAEKDKIASNLQSELEYYETKLLSIRENIDAMISPPILPRIKWNLNVAQLGYLFKALHEEGIIEIEKGKKEKFYRTIAGFSSTNGSVNLTNNSFKNNFLKTNDLNAVNFLQEKFTHMMQKAIKDKEILDA